MKHLILIFVITTLSLHVWAGEVQEIKSFENAVNIQSLQKIIAGNFVSAFEKNIQQEIDQYNQRRLAVNFVQKSVERLEPQDSRYAISLMQQNRTLVLPEIIWEKGKYTTTISGVKISFGIEEIFRGQILIAGHPFTIYASKTLEEIRGDLEVFIKEQNIVEGTNSGNKLFKLFTSLFGIPEAEALIPLVVIAVCILIAALGVGFWMKSKKAKLDAVKTALRQADQEISQKANACEQSVSEDTAYDTTFDLMKSVIQKKTENTAAGAFYSTLLTPSSEGDPTTNCNDMVNSFIQKTLGGSSVAAGDTSEIGELRIQLCGGNTPRQILLGEGERVGNYVRLKNCVATFHTTHEAVTDQNRGSVWIDDESGLVRNRNYYQRSVSH